MAAQNQVNASIPNPAIPHMINDLFSFINNFGSIGFEDSIPVDANLNKTKRRHIVRIAPTSDIVV